MTGNLTAVTNNNSHCDHTFVSFQAQLLNNTERTFWFFSLVMSEFELKMAKPSVKKVIFLKKLKTN